MVVALFRPAVLRYWEFSQLIRRGGCWVSLVVQVNQSVWEGRETLAVFSLVTHKPVVLVSLFFFWLKPLSTLCYFLSCCPFFFLLFCCWDSRAAPACLQITSLHTWSCPVHLTGTWVEICLFLKIFFIFVRTRYCLLRIVSLLGHSIKPSVFIRMPVVFRDVFALTSFLWSMYAFTSSMQ